MNNINTPLYKIDEKVVNKSKPHPDKILIVKKIIPRSEIEDLGKIHDITIKEELNPGNFWYVVEKLNGEEFYVSDCLDVPMNLLKNQTIYITTYLAKLLKMPEYLKIK